MPLSPKPPGTRMHQNFSMFYECFLKLYFQLQQIDIDPRLIFYSACSKASLIDLYESFNSVYLPTKETVTSFSGSSLAFTTLFQSFNLACLVLIFISSE